MVKNDFEKSASELRSDVEKAIKSSRNEIMVHGDDLESRVKKVERSVVAVPEMVDTVVKNIDKSYDELKQVNARVTSNSASIEG